MYFFKIKMYQIFIIISIFLSVKLTIEVDNFNFFKDFIIDNILLHSLSYTLLFLFVYKVFMFDKNDFSYYTYIDKIGKNYLKLHELYADRKLIPTFNVKKRKIKKIYYIGIVCIFVSLNILISNKIIEISTLCILLLCLYQLLFSKKESFTKTNAIIDFYNQYLKLYEKTGETTKNFGKKHYGEKYKNFSTDYLLWLESDEFNPTLNRKKYFLVKKYAEYRLSITEIEYLVDDILHEPSSSSTNIKNQKINFIYKIWLFLKLNN